MSLTLEQALASGKPYFYKATKYKGKIHIRPLRKLKVREELVFEEKIYIQEPLDCIKVMIDCFDLSKQPIEYGFLIALNEKDELIGVVQLDKGTATRTHIDLVKYITVANTLKPKSIVTIHNHPATNCAYPSEADINTAWFLKKARIFYLDMECLLKDSLIIDKGNQYYSFAEEVWTDDELWEEL